MSSCVPLYNALHWRKLKDHEDKDLPQEDILKLWGFYNMLKGTKECICIMRGESNENLMDQFGIDANHPDLLTKYIFMTGEKGRICWENKRYLDPDDTRKENFEVICKALDRFIREGCRGESGRSMRMRDFYKRNEAFCRAFNSIDDIVSRYEKLKTKDRERANLYYLAIAHAINSYDYRKASSMVSATTDESVAKKFTSDVCIYGWVPKVAISCAQMKTICVVDTKETDFIKQKGLPYYNTPVYPNQKEVALRCGFLPHFIIGFMVGSRFYVNPAVSRSMDKMQEMRSFKELNEFKKKLVRFGLDVDQCNFEEFCRLTRFKRYYTFNGEKYEIHCLDTRQ